MQSWLGAEQMDLHGMNKDEALAKLADILGKVGGLAPWFAAGFELEVVTGMSARGVHAEECTKRITRGNERQ